MDKLTIIICIVASVAICLFTWKQKKDYTKGLNAYKESTKDYQKVSFTKGPSILIGIMTLIAVIVVIYGFVQDSDYIWIGILLVVMCITEYAALPSRFVLYYNENSFMGDKGKVLYRNIKGYEFKKIMPTKGTVCIKLYSGDDVIVPYKVYAFIVEQVAKAKEKKKELKESRKKHAA